MERIKISLPDNFKFSTVIKVRITDLNYGGHVGNDSFLALVHEARMQFLNNFGYSELKLENTSLIMFDAAIEFKKELNYGDEVKISVAANGFDTRGFDIFYKMEIINRDAPVLAAKAKTGMLCYDYNNKKLTGVPEKVKETLI
ncbi:acyl-CoA thioesterase [Parafilimonas terrae]|jgi:YbgC/YbaW family acyl-CoA thioester hydrolase|uniref:Acyl-CoA thioester hydrolase, YbgC/YbaW family n=1 Tax=Parafilimonas terrae TaxID=1465490 RepID=A0A1I5UTK1_9BACT|nr:thioesterase family protein [Parafilimonas terrae]SFP98591.1 acyl-CoA thioester hydrolase, YbgC/YbaW family [Parafilimonas terrae]